MREQANPQDAIDSVAKGWVEVWSEPHPGALRDSSDLLQQVVEASAAMGVEVRVNTWRDEEYEFPADDLVKAARRSSRCEGPTAGPRLCSCCSCTEMVAQVPYPAEQQCVPSAHTHELVCMQTGARDEGADGEEADPTGARPLGTRRDDSQHGHPRPGRPQHRRRYAGKFYSRGALQHPSHGESERREPRRANRAARSGPREGVRPGEPHPSCGNADRPGDERQGRFHDPVALYVGMRKRFENRTAIGSFETTGRVGLLQG